MSTKISARAAAAIIAVKSGSPLSMRQMQHLIARGMIKGEKDETGRWLVDKSEVENYNRPHRGVRGKNDSQY